MDSGSLDSWLLCKSKCLAPVRVTGTHHACYLGVNFYIDVENPWFPEEIDLHFQFSASFRMFTEE